MNLVIPAAFILLACALLWVLIGARGSWVFKLFVMILTLIIGIEIWSGINSYMGHPRDTDLASVKGKVFILFWTRINEHGDTGPILMLMTPEKPEKVGLFDYQANDPQLFKFNYTRSLHKNAQDAMQEILKSDGEPIEVTFALPASTNTTNEHGETKAHSQGIPDPQLYILPPEKLPSKPGS